MPLTHARPGRLGGGIGLLLMMIVILIGMSMYFGSFGGSKSYMQQMATAKKQGVALATEINTQQLTTCVWIYKNEHGKLPETAEQLNCGPLLDPWHKPLTFTYKIEKGGATEVTYVIWRSGGPDLTLNTPDDIINTDRLPTQ
ncbi:MAG TPA: hypothetical protein VD997_11960 [Phycisphaerales bacterium]|nr:hypothetical protein [Phycisphaerales bacterium]